MVVPGKHLAWLLTLSALLVGCGDRPPPVEPAERSTVSPPTTAAAGHAAAPLADAEVLELSPGVRAAMTRTLSAAVAELDIPSEAPMGALNDFFQQLEAQQAAQRAARTTLPRTIQR